MRNISVALGNAPQSIEVQEALKNQKGKISGLVDEHINWALQQQGH